MQTRGNGMHRYRITAQKDGGHEEWLHEFPAISNWAANRVFNGFKKNQRYHGHTLKLIKYEERVISTRDPIGA